MNRWPAMNEYREQHPLLSGEVNEEETYSPQFSRRLRAFRYRGGSRNHLKGAAAILTHWPDHWASFLVYLWIGLGMVCLITFIIYNSVLVFPMIKPVHSKSVLTDIEYPIETTTSFASLPQDVYMHVFVDQNEEVDFNEYIPYVEEVSNKYTCFNFHLIILLNVTNMKDLSDEEHNEIAMNALWDHEKRVKKETIKRSNIYIEYFSLPTYMENSPLQKYWKTLPHHHVKFLARAISIWNKGGVTFDPEILTPRSPHYVYAEKLKKLLNKFEKHQTQVLNKKTVASNKITISKDRKRPHLNNIRDIIDALGSNDDSKDILSHELVEAEDKDLLVITRSVRENSNATESKKMMEILNFTTTPYQIDDDTIPINSEITRNSNSFYSFEKRNNTESSILPLFLEYLFHYKLINKTESWNVTTNDLTRERKSVINRQKHGKSNLFMNHPISEISQKTTEKYGPVIISAKEININKSVNNKEVTKMRFSEDEDEIIDANRLTIDLKGNIIATDIPCHAFLGTIFSNAIHHTEEESVTDFIISELTNFCNGLLSSCMGIDVILF